MARELKIATLTDDEVTKIRALEALTGKHIMAFESGPPFADLSEEHLAQVQALEEELEVLLLVYEK